MVWTKRKPSHTSTETYITALAKPPTGARFEVSPQDHAAALAIAASAEGFFRLEVIPRFLIWPFKEAPHELQFANGGDEGYLILCQPGDEDVQRLIKRLTGPRGVDAGPCGWQGIGWQYYVTHNG